jgi:glycosyltransferase involved in cell wall biosynthesis
MKRVLLINNIPAPYFEPLFARLAAERDWLLRVCYTSTWNANAGWIETPISAAPYRTIILDRERPWLTRLVGSTRSAGLSLIAELWRERPGYVISYGYTLLPQFVAIVWSVLTGTPFAVIGDANIYDDRAAGGRRAVKKVWLEWVVRHAAALIAIGTANRMFWEKYGARREQLFEARYAVNNDYFARSVEVEAGAASELRSKWGLQGKVVFLFVGRLVGRKNVDLLVRAFRELADENIALVIAGDGEERSVLETLAAGDSRVIFTGPVAQMTLPRFYALADALVLPARDEPWGLVVNEAMAAGLAVIAHQHCGAAVDLVGPDNGVALETFTVGELTEALRHVASAHGQRFEMKARSREKIEDWSIEGAARGIVEAVTRSSEGRVPRPAAAAVGEVK